MLKSNKIGRPKVSNPKNVDVKVRFDEETHLMLEKYCEDNNTTKTKVIRNGVNNMIKLKNGLESKHLEKYNQILNNFDLSKFKDLSREEQRNQITTTNDILRELYGLTEKVRDQYLMEEYGKTYKECFEESIEVSMPIDVNILHLQKEFYTLIMTMYETQDIYGVFSQR